MTIGWLAIIVGGMAALTASWWYINEWSFLAALVQILFGVLVVVAVMGDVVLLIVPAMIIMVG